ncbi:MAG: hypothetical protein ACRDTV_04760 [Mycobacterium sp.]
MFAFPPAGRLITVVVAVGAYCLGFVGNAAAEPGTQDDLNTLMGELPQGYSSANCTEEPIPADSPLRALVTVTCGQANVPNGPTGAVFALYRNPADADAQLRDAGPIDLATCPNSGPSPTTWQRNSAPGQIAGLIECGTDSNNKAALLWTDHPKLLGGFVAGSDIPTLYQWWNDYA